jgi:c-di-GMP-related signal transduction protein
MAPQSAFALRIPTSPEQSAESLRHVARQPILDASGKLYAYELLFRSGPEAVFRGDSELATRTMFDNTVVFGMESLTDGLPAFVNCTHEALTGTLVELLPPHLTVLEILETVEPTPSLLAACHRLKARGFRLALDDFVWEPRFDPVIELADYIKVDFLLSGPGVRQDLLHRIHGKPIHLLAEKVETQEQFQKARDEGFTLFQGYYFCRPTLLSQRNLPANSLEYFQLIAQLQKHPLDLNAVCPIIKRDAALCYRLLRLVNSPIYPHHGEIRSIRSAILTVGEDTFRRLAILLATSSLASPSDSELLRMALVRARFCELAAVPCRLDATEQYLLGMFSLLPTMLRVSLEDIAAKLPLRPAISDALRGKACPERTPLAWIEACELADWLRCDALCAHHGIHPDTFHRAAQQAVRWTHSILQSAR